MLAARKNIWSKHKQYLKEILNTYRQHIQQPELQQIDVECYIIAFSGGDFKIMSSFAIREDNTVLRVICDIIF